MERGGKSTQAAGKEQAVERMETGKDKGAGNEQDRKAKANGAEISNKTEEAKVEAAAVPVAIPQPDPEDSKASVVPDES